MKVFEKGLFETVTIIPSTLLHPLTYESRKADPTLIAHTIGKPTVGTTVDSECERALKQV